MVKGLDKEHLQALPWLACVFRRTCRINALWLFEHLQWQWITPVDPLWSHLQYTSVAAAEKPRSTADNLSQPLCAVLSHIISNGSLLFTVKWAFVRSSCLKSTIWIKCSLNYNWGISRIAFGYFTVITFLLWKETLWKALYGEFKAQGMHTVSIARILYIPIQKSDKWPYAVCKVHIYVCLWPIFKTCKSQKSFHYFCRYLYLYLSPWPLWILNSDWKADVV